MAHMFGTKKIFKQYLLCSYAVNVTSQQANRTSKNLRETKLYCFAKPKLIGCKIEVFVFSNDRAIEVSRHIPGSTVNIDTFLGRRDQNQSLLTE